MTRLYMHACVRRYRYFVMSHTHEDQGRRSQTPEGPSYDTDYKLKLTSALTIKESPEGDLEQVSWKGFIEAHRSVQVRLVSFSEAHQSVQESLVSFLEAQRKVQTGEQTTCLCINPTSADCVCINVSKG